MNSLKWIFIHGGIGWGIPFAVLIYAIRWIENKPPAFGSFFILLISSILGGIVWGYSTYKFDEAEEKKTFSMYKFLKSMALIFMIFFIYGLIFRYLFIPYNLDRHFISTAVLYCLAFSGLFLHNKLFMNNKEDKSYSKGDYP